MEAKPPDPPDPPDPPHVHLSPPCFTPSQSEPQNLRKRASDAADMNPESLKKIVSNIEETSPSLQNIYTHPTYSQPKTYSCEDKGPFVVHVARAEPDPAAGTTIRPIKFGKFLYTLNIKNIVNDGVTAVGRNRISVTFSNFTDANSFITNPLLFTNKYVASVPTFNVTRMGVVRGVPTDWSMDELVESIELPQGCGNILKARRINRKQIVDGSPPVWIPTQTVVLTFRGQMLPSRVFCFHTSLKVDIYQLPSILCNNCCRFGHIKAQCRSKPRCFRCSQPHNGESCERVTPSCLFCSGNHMATNKNCPEHARQKTIKITMATENISYSEASSRFPPVKRSYAEVAKELFTSPSPTYKSPFNPSPASNDDSVRPIIKSLKKKTMNSTPRPRTLLNKGYDRKAHADIVQTPSSSMGNGCALQYDSSPNDNFIELLISMLSNIICKYNDCLPPNVAQKLAQLISISNYNGSTEEDFSDAMELQESAK